MRAALGAVRISPVVHTTSSSLDDAIAKASRIDAICSALSKVTETVSPDAPRIQMQESASSALTA
jgi:hypothetical protein